MKTMYILRGVSGSGKSTLAKNLATMSGGYHFENDTYHTDEKGVEIIESIGHTAQSKEFWGVKTQAFIPVSMVMNSPNHWDDNATGNKHLFFMLKGAKNPGDTRGFYNEYLRNELNEHKKVFEHLAGKMKAKYTDDQLSGIGFSDTKRDELLVKVTGQFTRTLKVKF